MFGEDSTEKCLEEIAKEFANSMAGGPRGVAGPPMKRTCVVCGSCLDGQRVAAVIGATLVDALSKDWPNIGESFSSMFLVCSSCTPALQMPDELKRRALMEHAGMVLEFWVCTQSRRIRMLNPVTCREQPIEHPTFFVGRSASLLKYCRNPRNIVAYCEQVEKLGLRAVGCFSSSGDIAAVYHYALLFAQEGFGEGLPIWFLDPRLIGMYRIAYLIKDPAQTAYDGVVAFATYGYQTLCWTWLRPPSRRKGVLSRIWPHLEHMHRDFKVQLPISAGMERFLERHPGHELTEFTGGKR